MTLVSAGKMQSDCDDMRFGDTSGNILDYWLESGCNTGSTVAWVEIPSLASGTSYIYMYYDNGSATAASNGAATFRLFDNFDDGNLTGWSTGQDNSSESTSVVVNTENVSACYSIRLYTYSSCYSSPYNGIIAWAQMAINPPSGTYVADAANQGSGSQHGPNNVNKQHLGWRNYCLKQPSLHLQQRKVNYGKKCHNFQIQLKLSPAFI